MENIILRETDKFIEITVNDGYVMTDWDGNDILNYTSTKQLVCPKGYDYGAYYTVTEEKDAEYRELQERAINELEKGA
jgi:hypothetical protein